MGQAAEGLSDAQWMVAFEVDQPGASLAGRFLGQHGGEIDDLLQDFGRK